MILNTHLYQTLYQLIVNLQQTQYQLILDLMSIGINSYIKPKAKFVILDENYIKHNANLQ